MRIMTICALALALAACTPEPETGTEGGAAEAIPEAHLAPTRFLFDLYSHYDGKQTFSPLGEAAPLYFDDELVALIREDDRLRGDEIGALDHDPVCQCQDYDRLQAQMKADRVTDVSARVAVTLTDKGRAPFVVTYDLVKNDGEWRIHDMSSATMTSLRAVFTRSNTELAKRRSR